MAETKVVNVRDGRLCDVYIARNTSYLQFGGHKGSVWRNPFHIGKDGDRAQVIDKYREYIKKRLAAEPDLVAQLLALKGKTLGCWCAPEACHGDVLVELIEEYSGAELVCKKTA